MSFVRKSLIVSCGQLLTSGLNMLIGVLYSRALGPDGMGRFELFRSTATIVATFSALGLGHASIYFLNNRKHNPLSVTTNSFKAAIGIGAVVGVGLTASVMLYPGYFGSVALPLAVWFSIGVGAHAAAGLLRPILVARLAAKQMTVVEIASASLLFAGGLMLAAIGVLSWQSALVLVALSLFSRFALLWLCIRSDIDLGITMDWVLLRQMLAYGVKLAAAAILYVLCFHITVMLLRYLVPDDFASVGLYTRAVAVCGLATLVPGAIGPLLYAKWSSMSGDDRVRQVELAARFNSTYGAIVAIALVLIGGHIIRFMYGPAYVDAQAALQILAPAVFFLTLLSVCNNLLAGDGRATINACILAGTLLVVAGVTVIAVPGMGIKGAALGAFCGNAFTAFTSLLVCNRLYGVNPLRCLLLRWHDIAYLRSAVIG